QCLRQLHAIPFGNIGLPQFIRRRGDCFAASVTRSRSGVLIFCMNENIKLNSTLKSSRLF
ncbi:MAG: hypothetical protein RSF78_11840, partial [Bacteroidales bacterium]